MLPQTNSLTKQGTDEGLDENSKRSFVRERDGSEVQDALSWATPEHFLVQEGEAVQARLGERIISCVVFVTWRFPAPMVLPSVT